MSGNLSTSHVRTIDLSEPRSGFREGPVPVTAASAATVRLVPFGSGSADGASVALVAGYGPIEARGAEAGSGLDTAASAAFSAVSGVVGAETIDDADVDGRGWLDGDVTATGADGAMCRVLITLKPQEG